MRGIPVIRTRRKLFDQWDASFFLSGFLTLCGVLLIITHILFGILITACALFSFIIPIIMRKIDNDR